MTPDETASEEKTSKSYWGFVLWPVVVVVLYVLSAAPVWKGVSKHVLSFRVLSFYEPLHRAIHASHLEKPYRMYLHLWMPEVWDAHGDAMPKKYITWDTYGNIFTNQAPIFQWTNRSQ